MPSRWPDAGSCVLHISNQKASTKSLLAFVCKIFLTFCVRLGIPSSVLGEVGCNAVGLSIPLADPPPSPPARGEGWGSLLLAPGDGGGTSGVLGRSEGLSVEFLAIIRAKKSRSHHIRSSRHRPTRGQDSHVQSLGVTKYPSGVPGLDSSVSVPDSSLIMIPRSAWIYPGTGSGGSAWRLRTLTPTPMTLRSLHLVKACLGFGGSAYETVLFFSPRAHRHHHQSVTLFRIQGWTHNG
jgi:hypothetical protein